MASPINNNIYNTELFNVVLEAMDNFKPILLLENNGAIQTFSVTNAFLKNTSGEFSIAVGDSFHQTYIYPSETTTSVDLYVPKNISFYSENEDSAGK